MARVSSFQIPHFVVVVQLLSPAWLFWRRKWQPTPVLLPGKFRGLRSLVGCSPWSRTVGNAWATFYFYLLMYHYGEGTGNPLRYSCLENPVDGRAWWPAVHRVAQSRTRLKRLSVRECVPDSLRPHSVAYQALLSMEFSRLEYWSGCCFFL